MQVASIDAISSMPDLGANNLSLSHHGIAQGDSAPNAGESARVQGVIRRDVESGDPVL